MRRALCMLMAGAFVSLPLMLVGAQSAPGPASAAQGATLLQLLDAVAEIELAAMDGRELGQREIEDLEQIAIAADTVGAVDLAARARLLLVLTRPATVRPEAQPDVTAGLSPPRERRLVRGDTRYRTLSYVLASGGVTAFGVSGALYALAERDFQRWRTAEDQTAGEELFQAWRGYELLGLGLGGVALLSVGIGLPLLHQVAVEPTALATPPGQPFYTERERQERLIALYSERGRIVLDLNELDERETRRTLVSRIGLTTGIVGTVSSITMFALAEGLYRRYVDAPFSDEAERLGRQVELFDRLAVISGGLALAGYGTTVGVSTMAQNREQLESRLRGVNRQIIELRMAPLAELP